MTLWLREFRYRYEHKALTSEDHWLPKLTKRNRPTVLVVDDDPSVLRSLGRLIRSAGFNAETFEHPGLLLQSKIPKANACLLLDVYMPEMNGVELSARLVSAGCNLPRIMITARDDEETWHLLEGLKAVGILHKPFDEALLLDAIGRAVALSNSSAR